MLTISTWLCAGAPAHSQVEIVNTRAVSTRAVTAQDHLPRSIRIFAVEQAQVGVSGHLAQVLEEAGIPVQVYLVDDLAKAEATLNASLPRNMEEAEALMKERIQNGMAMDQEVQRGWTNVLMARQFQIRQVPAVVFDDSQVVYGEFSLESALRHYQARAELSR